jgi:type II restriction enzyme
MPNNPVDILENDFSPEILSLLLRDHTTEKNILWCTHDYESRGEGYQYADEIKPECITGEHGNIIRPRVLKSKAEQKDRVKDMAEVFTPSRVVKKMVDNVDIDVCTRCLELTCGEAPFLVSRYDATTGEPIVIGERVGVLDRKLRIVKEQQLIDAEWLSQVRLAFQNTYGYEWHGDSLLLARENLLYTFVDHFEARFSSSPDISLLREFAEIISWNLWQMDGLTYRIPREKQAPQPTDQYDLFAEAPAEAPAPLCIIKNWQTGKTIKVNDIKRKITKNQDIMKFDVIIGNPPYQEETASDSTRKPPIFNFFMDEAYKCADKVELITPARFLFRGGYTSKAWDDKMLNDSHFKVLNYESDSTKIFGPNIQIEAGIAITYRDSTQDFGSIGTFVKYGELWSIMHRVMHNDRYAFVPLSDIISPPLSYQVSEKLIKDFPEAVRLRSNAFEALDAVFKEERPFDSNAYIQMEGLLSSKRTRRYVLRDYITDSSDTLDKWKVFVPESNGASGKLGDEPARIISKPIIAEPGVGYTQTYIAVGKFETEFEAKACLNYVLSKFTRAMLGILKVTQHNPGSKWICVPLQDFTPSSDIDWSKSIAEIDEQLFDKYGLDEQERNFIRTKVKEMA